MCDKNIFISILPSNTSSLLMGCTLWSHIFSADHCYCSSWYLAGGCDNLVQGDDEIKRCRLSTLFLQPHPTRLSLITGPIPTSRSYADKILRKNVQRAHYRRFSCRSIVACHFSFVYIHALPHYFHVKVYIVYTNTILSTINWHQPTTSTYSILHSDIDMADSPGFATSRSSTPSILFIAHQRVYDVFIRV